MVLENLTWGAKRIRGELLKLGVIIAKSTIQRYIHELRPVEPQRQGWSAFLHNHASAIWACDLLQTYDILFRSLFVFVIIDLGSRRIVQWGVTRHPTDTWHAQQVRNATAFGAGPRYLIRDNDSKYGTRFDRAVAGAGVVTRRTPRQAPRANAMCERFYWATHPGRSRASSSR
jgi:putative transposase